MMPPLNTASIPQELKERSQWVNWKIEMRDGKETKVPYQHDGVHAMSNTPQTWSSLDTCMCALEDGNGRARFSGIGFVFNHDYTGTDFDNCVDSETGEIMDPDVARMVRQLNSYTEYSPSHCGLHVINRASKPGARCKTGNFEMYDFDRFFTMTGHHFPGSPTTIESNQDAVNAVYYEVFGDDNNDHDDEPTLRIRDNAVANKHGDRHRDSDVIKKATAASDKFRRLFYDGDTSDYSSQSEADLALCGLLRRSCGGDRTQTDRIFRRSALYRSKWDEWHGAQKYGDMTISKACEGNIDVYNGQEGDQCGCEVYFDRNRFVAKRVADDILSRHYFFTFTDTEEIYAYDALEGIFRPGGEQIIRDETQRLLGERTTNHFVNEVEGGIRRSRYFKRDELVVSPDLIPVNNGVLDRSTRTLTPYTPEKPFISKIAVNFDPNADCPAFKLFLQETFYTDDIPVVEEIIGDTFYRSYWHKKSLMLLGPGDNGKSVLLGVEGSLLGKQNISARGLQELERDKFAKADLFGKFANIYADLSSIGLQKTGTFKLLTGRDHITAERKYKDPFTYINYAKLHFSANELPATKDQTPAFFDRWLLIEPPYRFVDHPRENCNEKQRDPQLLEKLTTDEELAGILNLALEGLDRLLANGQFTKSNASEAVKERWIARTDSLQAFVKNCVQPKKDCFVTKDNLFASYQQYCEEHALAAVEKQVVGRRLPTLVQTIGYKPQVDGKRVTAWKDIKVVNVEEMQDKQEAVTKDAQETKVTAPDLGSFFADVTDVKANFNSSRRYDDDSSDVVSTEEECENPLDMCDAPFDFVVAQIKERLQLRKANRFRVLHADDLMAGIVADIHLDYSDVDPAAIAAKFRQFQQSDEGRRLISELLPGSNSEADVYQREAGDASK
jgi:putative DNA primase/helicase